MAKKKVCKICKMFVEEDTCTNCGASSFSNNWQGRFYVSEVARSMIAEKLGVKTKGEYAIKVK